jgi:hypothetical protein
LPFGEKIPSLPICSKSSLLLVSNWLGQRAEINIEPERCVRVSRIVNAGCYVLREVLEAAWSLDHHVMELPQPQDARPGSAASDAAGWKRPAGPSSVARPGISIAVALPCSLLLAPVSSQPVFWNFQQHRITPAVMTLPDVGSGFGHAAGRLCSSIECAFPPSVSVMLTQTVILNRCFSARHSHRCLRNSSTNSTDARM